MPDLTFPMATLVFFQSARDHGDHSAGSVLGRMNARRG
jgi:hypothetical protein